VGGTPLISFNGGSNEIVIGNSAGAGSNTVVIGNSSVTDVYLGSSSASANLHAANLYAGDINCSGTLRVGGTAVSAQVTSQSWSIFDVSGGGFTLSGSVSLSQAGNMITAYGNITYPSTGGDVHTVQIGWLPSSTAAWTAAYVPSGNCVAYIGGTVIGTFTVWPVVGTFTYFRLLPSTSSSFAINNSIGGATLYFSFTYPVS
jgi:hypothetical protein